MTVDAIEWTVFVELRRCSGTFSCFSTRPLVGLISKLDECIEGVALARLGLIRNLQTKYVRIAMAAMPPITPPTIGPAPGLLLLPEPFEISSGVQMAVGQALQPCAVREHLNPEAQEGHLGAEAWSHFMQSALFAK